MRTLFIIICEITFLVYTVNADEKQSIDYNDFGDKMTQNRRLISPKKEVQEKSLFERLSEVKDSFENPTQNSRAIEYSNEKSLLSRIPNREELIKKLKFDLQPKATLHNQTITVDGLSVSTNLQSPASLSSLPFDTKLLNQLGSLLPGGGSRGNVKDIHAELQGMLFGDDAVTNNEEGDKKTEIVQKDTDIDGVLANLTNTDAAEDLMVYDLMDYMDYTDDEYEEDEQHDSLDEDDEVDDLTSIDDLDQTAEESIHYDRNVAITFQNMSSSSLPLVGNRRHTSGVRFPERQIQNQSVKMPLRSRLRNKQRLLNQQHQNEEISSRIINRKPNRNRYNIPEAKSTKNEYGLDYEGR